ncbi:bifunctional riboflavin kinase/FAD synthetase [Listeria grandensis]|uniref:Riboflavin biosynthesis protein n=1 Tax=Listeria grandensis TaxID=1494963 RepID=A0A7X0Y172_9LIST|nr:bifunctional riboflavin kinase/FAD synthetase [Listeria grandensis]MBC1935061.1 bifunctional riboflavin kinase/FAD synthetase [Listeria grandensis]
METYFLHHPPEKMNRDPKVIALGFFDGLHRGHQEVINTAKKEAEKRRIKTAVLTFDPHPSVVLSQMRTQVKYLTPIEEKKRKMAELGVDILYIVRFTTAFSNLSPEDFVSNYLIGLNAKHVVAGFDYSFGRQGAGKMTALADYAQGQFDVTIVQKLEDLHDKVSSTNIRKYIAEGQLDEANQLLGYPYTITGTVIHGDKRGRTIGFPTANIAVDEGFLIPKLGVYAVRFKVNGKIHLGMASIGYNITFKDDQEMSIEVYILDFHQEIYGEEIEIEWFHYFRPELKFNGVEGLIEQLKQDEVDTRAYFA